jgi:DNA-binding CsgD family transcriptional regulator
MNPDVMQLVGSVYDMERDTSAWISGILGHLQACITDTLGLFGFTYSVSENNELVPGAFATTGCSMNMVEGLPFAVTQVGPGIVRDAYLAADSCAASDLPGWRVSAAAEIARRDGVAEVWFVNGRNEGNKGCALCVNRRSRDALPPDQMRFLSRISEHLASANRLRERLRGTSAMEWAEAVMAPDGRLLHATGDAQRSDALPALRTGVLSMDRNRGKLRKSDPTGALCRGKGPGAARWIFLEHFDGDGRRYILAHEKDPKGSPAAAVSPREREVLARAALGRSNKEIAYDLGIAHSTVRVLLVRAARRLGVRTRADAIRKFDVRNAVERARG